MIWQPSHCFSRNGFFVTLPCFKRLTNDRIEPHAASWRYLEVFVIEPAMFVGEILLFTEPRIATMRDVDHGEKESADIIAGRHPQTRSCGAYTDVYRTLAVPRMLYGVSDLSKAHLN